MQSRLLLDVVVAQSAPILKLLSSKNKTLLIRGDALLVLNLGLNVVDGVAGLNVEGDGLASQGLNENLCFEPTTMCVSVHFCRRIKHVAVRIRVFIRNATPIAQAEHHLIEQCVGLTCMIRCL